MSDLQGGPGPWHFVLGLELSLQLVLTIEAPYKQYLAYAVPL